VCGDVDRRLAPRHQLARLGGDRGAHERRGILRAESREVRVFREDRAEISPASARQRLDARRPGGGEELREVRAHEGVLAQARPHPPEQAGTGRRGLPRRQRAREPPEQSERRRLDAAPGRAPARITPSRLAWKHVRPPAARWPMDAR